MYRIFCIALGVSALSLNCLGAEFFGSVTNDTSKVISGGLAENVSTRTHVTLGFEHQFVNGLTFYIDSSLLRGDNGSDDVGDIQAYSNIDADKHQRIYEAWVQTEVATINSRAKFGLLDANTEFAFVEEGGEFINASMGFSPTISYLPTYAEPTLAFNGFWSPAENNQLALGVYSDDSNEFREHFYILEYNQNHQALSWKLGGWYQSGSFDSLEDGSDIEGATGTYVTLEGGQPFQVFQSSRSGWFTQFGFSSKDTSEIVSHIGVGVAWYDVFSREGDGVGLGVTHVESSKYTWVDLKKDETSFEFYYRWQINDHIVIKPDLQYIINPAADIAAEDALVATLRTELSL